MAFLLLCVWLRGAWSFLRPTSVSWFMLASLSDRSLGKSHEPTMATDVFLAGIQEQEPLPRSVLFALLPACRWISIRSRGRKPPQARIHGPDANCRAGAERKGCETRASSIQCAR